MVLQYAFKPALLLSAFLAVVQVVLTMVPGAYYAWKGVVSPETRRTLSIVSWFLLLPAMSFYNIVEQISASTILSLWPFAANTLLGTVLGIGLGVAGAAATRSPRHLWRHIAASSGFGNTNSLPLLIMAAVCQQEDMPFFQALGGQCTSVGFGYVALGSAATQIIMFPVAAWLLGKRPAAATGSEALPEASDGIEDSSVSKVSSYSNDEPSEAFWVRAVEEGQVVSADEAGTEAASPKPASLPGTQPSRQIVLAADASARSASSQPLEEVQQPAAAEPSKARRLLARTWAFVRTYYLSPAAVVPALGIAVACIAPLKNLLVPQTSAPLGFSMGALESIQQALLFVTSFILGAVLCKGPGPGQKDLGWRPCVLLVALRMVLMPMLGAVIVIGSHALGLWTPLNPAFTFVLLLQWAVPTANQMQNLASMSGSHEYAIGAMIFWQYVVAFLALPGWMSAYLWLMGKFSLM